MGHKNLALKQGLKLKFLRGPNEGL